MKKITRREWLGRGLIGLVLFGFGSLLFDVWVSARRFSSAHWNGLIDLDHLPGDGIYPFPAQKVALIVANDRMAAISLECTHLGCLVSADGSGFYCPCHGSEFGPHGQVYSGPATKPLPWYRVRLQDGRIWFHSGTRRDSPDWIELQRTATGRRTHHVA